jgi:hypothetical protein
MPIKKGYIMELKELIKGKNPIVHKSWPIGEYLFHSSRLGMWKKESDSISRLTPMPFNIEEAILNDDGGYFELPPHRPSYEEVVMAANLDMTTLKSLLSKMYRNLTKSYSSGNNTCDEKLRDEMMEFIELIKQNKKNLLLGGE